MNAVLKKKISKIDARYAFARAVKERILQGKEQPMSEAKKKKKKLTLTRLEKSKFNVFTHVLINVLKKQELHTFANTLKNKIANNTKKEKIHAFVWKLVDVLSEKNELFTFTQTVLDQIQNEYTKEFYEKKKIWKKCKRIIKKRLCKKRLPYMHKGLLPFFKKKNV